MNKKDVAKSSSIQFDIRHWLRQIELGANVKEVLEEVYATAHNRGRSYGAYHGDE